MKKKLIPLKPKIKKQIPYLFILDLLDGASPEIRPMFGCYAIYIGPKITLILREREDHPSDNGVWLATTVEHHESLKREFPSMRSIEVFGPGVRDGKFCPPQPLISNLPWNEPVG